MGGRAQRLAFGHHARPGARGRAGRAADATHVYELRWRALLVGFIKARPSILRQVPTDTVSQGGAWPSPRSWDRAYRMAAAADAAAASKAVRAALVVGLVGTGPSIEFLRYVEAVDLPDPEELLADPSALRLDPRVDLLLAGLASVTTAVAMDCTCDRWDAAWEVLVVACHHDRADRGAGGDRSARPARTGGGRHRARFHAFVPILRDAGPALGRSDDRARRDPNPDVSVRSGGPGDVDARHGRLRCCASVCRLRGSRRACSPTWPRRCSRGPVPSPELGTFAVDRWWRVYVDMDQARHWGVEADSGGAAHEANHVLLDDHRRADAAGVTAGQHMLWNLAGDAAINDDLVADGHPLPDPVLPADFGLPSGRLEETYFRHLLGRPTAEAPLRCGSGSGRERLAVELDDDPSVQIPGGSMMWTQQPFDAASSHDVEAAQARLGEPVSPGLVLWLGSSFATGAVADVVAVGDGRDAAVDHGASASHLAAAHRRADSRPDFPQPGRRRISPNVAVVVDTSASMSASLLDAAVTELDEILRRSGANGVTVVVCDRDAVAPQHVRRLAQLELTGGGGTDMRVGIHAAREPSALAARDRRAH